MLKLFRNCTQSSAKSIRKNLENVNYNITAGSRENALQMQLSNTNTLKLVHQITNFTTVIFVQHCYIIMNHCDAT